MSGNYQEFSAVPLYAHAIFGPQGEIVNKGSSLPIWSNDKPLPAIGTQVHVRINGIGAAVVEKYFIEYGFLGLLVRPLNPPDWYVKQNGRRALGHVFGIEVDL